MPTLPLYGYDENSDLSETLNPATLCIYHLAAGTGICDSTGTAKGRPLLKIVSSSNTGDASLPPVPQCHESAPSLAVNPEAESVV